MLVTSNELATEERNHARDLHFHFLTSLRMGKIMLMETDRPLWCHSLTGERGRPRMKTDRLLGLHSFDEE
jgi:hypothetical protein